MRQRLLRTFLLISGLFFLQGCVSSGNYYVLSMAHQPSTVYPSKNRVIGVEKIIVPAYLYKRELAVARSSSQITLLGSAKWGEDMDEGLTNRLISFLQKKFNEPRVYLYPWDLAQQPSLKIKVQISRFIAQGDRVYLDANWEVENLRNGQRKARLFSTSVPTSSDPSVIVDSMDKAFSQLEASIASAIR